MTNVQQGAVPSPYQSLARDVAQDVVRPPSAVRRMDRYDGARGTDHDRSHRPDRREHATVAVHTLSGRMGQPTVSKGCKRSRYEGGQATKTCAKVKRVMQAALVQGEGVIKDRKSVV